MCKLRIVYIPTQILNFALIPPHLRAVFVSSVSVFWSTPISFTITCRKLKMSSDAYLSASNASHQAPRGTVPSPVWVRNTFIIEWTHMYYVVTIYCMTERPNNPGDCWAQYFSAEDYKSVRSQSPATVAADTLLSQHPSAHQCSRYRFLSWRFVYLWSIYRYKYHLRIHIASKQLLLVPKLYCQQDENLVDVIKSTAGQRMCNWQSHLKLGWYFADSCAEKPPRYGDISNTKAMSSNWYVSLKIVDRLWCSSAPRHVVLRCSGNSYNNARARSWLPHFRAGLFTDNIFRVDLTTILTPIKTSKPSMKLALAICTLSVALSWLFPGVLGHPIDGHAARGLEVGWFYLQISDILIVNMNRSRVLRSGTVSSGRRQGLLKSARW